MTGSGLLDVVILVGAGLCTGFLNALAGGGSVITLPVLEWATGLPGVANGTNRVAILLQNVVGVAGFHTGKAVPWKIGLKASVPAVLGGIAGAYLATVLDAGAMRYALSGAIVVVAVTALFRPTRTPRLKSPWTELAFFGAGFYLGFVQAGVGFLLLACLVGGLGLDLVRANGAKLLIVLFVTVPTVIIFHLHGQVFWREGLLVATGTMGGAWIASRLAIKKGAAWVRYVVVFAACVAIVKLLVFPSGV